MAVSEFLPFATGAGANVLSQPDFAADPATVSGYASGQVQSAKVNKLWRQSSFMSAAMAKVILEQLGVDVLDNGDLNELSAKLTQTIANLGSGEGGGPGGGIPESPVDGAIYGRGNLTWTAVVPAGGGSMTGALSIRATATAPALSVTRNAANPVSLPTDTVARFIGTDAVVSRVVIDAFGQHSELSLRRANGTATSPTTIQNGNLLAVVGAYGRGSTLYSAAARASVDFLAAENWTETAQGTMVRLSVTPPGSTTSIAGLIVSSTGVTLAAPLTVPNGGTGVNNFTVPAHSWGFSGTLLQGQGTNPVSPTYLNTDGMIGTWANHQIGCIGILDEAGIDLGRCKGSLSAPTALTTGSYIGTLWFEGYGATKWNTGPRAQISVIATENWTDTKQGTTMNFAVTPTGSLNTFNEMWLDGDGLGLTQPLKVNSGGTGRNNLPVTTGSAGTSITGTLLLAQGYNPIIPLSDTTGTVGTQANNGAGLTFLSSGGYQSHMFFLHGHGSLAAPAAVPYNFPLGVLYFAGYGGTGWSESRGLIACMTNENWTSTAQGTRFVFNTTLNGSLATDTVFTIDGQKGIFSANKHLHFIGAVNNSVLDIFDDGNSHIETNTQLWLNGNSRANVAFGGAAVFQGQGQFNSSDGIYLTSQPGGDARIFYNCWGFRVWSAGPRTDANWWIRDESGGAGRFAIDVNGHCYNTTGSWVVLSDRRFKKDIADISTGLDELRKLRPVRYKLDGPAGTLMGEDGVQRFGLLADEVKKVLPDIVRTAEFDQLGEIDTIDPGPLLYIMLNAIRQLSAKVDELSRKE